MLGAIIGDIVGSVFEFNNTKDMWFEFYSKESNYTDDTIMTMAVADYLMTDPTYHETLEGMMVDYARMYPCPKGGYGGRFRKWLFHPEELNADGSNRRHPINSYGNGSAMRVSSVGWLFNKLKQVEQVAKITAEITHNHPEGIKGAQATAVAIMMARHGNTKEEIRSFIEKRYGYNLQRTCADIRPTYTFNETCQGTVPEAIIAFLDSRNFEEAIRLAVSLGGDSDTLACITGGIAEAFYKEIPDWIRQGAYAVLPDHFKHILEQLYKVSKSREETYLEEPEPSHEQVYANWQIENFYRTLAEEEGTKPKEMKMKEIRLLDFTIAGTTFCKEFDKTDGKCIEDGMTLIVKREDNKHDPNAVALYADEMKIGYIPKKQNEAIARLLEAGKVIVSKIIHAEYNEGWEKIEARIWMVEL